MLKCTYWKKKFVNENEIKTYKLSSVFILFIPLDNVLSKFSRFPYLI